MRILHTMLRVGNLDRSIEFYTKVLGMRVLRSTEYPTGRFTSAYDLGTGYGHIALQVENAYEACDRVKQLGGKVTREAGPMKHGSTVIAFVEDPDGYKIEFVQKKFD